MAHITTMIGSVTGLLELNSARVAELQMKQGQVCVVGRHLQPVEASYPIVARLVLVAHGDEEDPGTSPVRVDDGDEVEGLRWFGYCPSVAGQPRGALERAARRQ